MRIFVRLLLTFLLVLPFAAHAEWDNFWDGSPQFTASCIAPEGPLAPGEAIEALATYSADSLLFPIDLDSYTRYSSDGSSTLEYACCPDEVLIDWTYTFTPLGGASTTHNRTGRYFSYKLPDGVRGSLVISAIARNIDRPVAQYAFESEYARTDESQPVLLYQYSIGVKDGYNGNLPGIVPFWQEDTTTQHDGDPVNLANGAERYTSGPDITAYNPYGPNVSLQRTYYSHVAGYNRRSPGFSLGWMTNYDTVIRKFGPDQNGRILLYMEYPNGAKEKVYEYQYTGDMHGNEPTYALQAFTRPAGAPYTIEGVPNDYVKVTWADRTQWLFAYDSVTRTYTLQMIVDRNDKAIEIIRSTSDLRGVRNRIERIIDPDRPSDPALLSFAYQPDNAAVPRSLQSITDRTGRTVAYEFRTGPESGLPELYRVSRVNESVSASAYRQQYEYLVRGNKPYLAKVSMRHPSGTGTVSTEIDYETTTDSRTDMYRVASTKDSNGFVREYAYHPTGLSVNGYELKDPMTQAPFAVTKVTVKRQDNGAWVTDRVFYQNIDPVTFFNRGRYEDGRESTITYGTSSHNYFRPVQVTDFNGRATTYTWNTYGNLTDVEWPSTAPSGYTKAHADYYYTTAGFPNLARIETWTGDANNATPRKTATKYHFDSLGRLSQIDRPVPGNDTGLSAWVQTTFGYDNTLGNLTTITAPVPNDTGSTVMATLSYTDANHPTAAKGQPLSISVPKGDGQNLVGRFEWNADGTLLAVKDALGNRTAFTYDASRRLEAVTYPITEAGKTLGAEVRYNRAFTGGPVNLAEVFSEGTSTSQPRLVDIALGYDAAGELNQVSGDTEPWMSTYDAEYRLRSLADARGQAGGYQTDYTYPFSDTSVGASITYPGNAAQGGSYDKLAAAETHAVGTAPYNSVVTVTDGRGTTKTLRYTGPFGELVDVEYVNSGIPNASDDNLHYDYDLYGRVTRVRHGVSDTSYQDITTFTYDDRDNVRTATTNYSGGPTKTITYAYYPDGSRKTMDVQGVGTFTYTYNLIGQMTGLTNPHGQSFAWAYDARGLLSHQYQGGLTGYDTAYTYDARGRLASSQITHGGGVYTNLPAFTELRYDAANNLTHYKYEYLSENNPPPIEAIVEGAGTDGAQAEGILEPPPSYYGYVDYTYEGGNFANGQPKPYGLLYREERTGPTAYDRSYTYDESYNPTLFRNQTVPTTYNRDNQRADIGYDGNGNPTNHVFDVENRLVQYNGISPTMTFRYNGFGLRAWKADSNSLSAKRFFFYDGTVPIAECYSNGGTLTLYTYGANGLAATSSSSSSYAYYGFDPSGNRAVAMGADTTGDNRVVDAFGQCDTGTPVIGFAGQWGAYTDSRTGLVLMGWRYYDPNTGRFLTRDPIGTAGGINLYAYCQNNPVNWVDPLGLWSVWKKLYTNDWNASDEVYKDAVEAGATWLYDSCPVRGGYIKFEVDIPGGNIAPIHGSADGKVGWSLDSGVGASTSLNAGVGNIFNIGGGGGWSQDGGLVGSIGASRVPIGFDAMNPFQGGATALRLETSGSVFGIGLIVDPDKLSALLNGSDAHSEEVSEETTTRTKN